MELQGKVCLELLQRDDWLVSTNKCDMNNGRVVRPYTAGSTILRMMSISIISLRIF
jgi:hypothetical protein